MKTCPTCRFLVGDSDAVCKVCGADITAGPAGRAGGPAPFGQPPPPPAGGGAPSTKWGVGTIIGVVVLCAIGWIAGYLIMDALLTS